MTTKALLLCFFSSCFLFNPIKTSEIQIISSIKSNWQDSTIDCLLVLNGFYEKVILITNDDKSKRGSLSQLSSLSSGLF